MRRTNFTVYILLIVILTSIIPVIGQAQGAGRIYAVSIDGEITPAMAAYLIRQLEQAHLSNADGIIIDISTLGGQVDAAKEMKDAILASEIPVTVFIGTRAISAGALIAIAADTIIMAPGSHMGAAEPIPLTEKTLAYVSGEFRTTAEAKGRDPLIAAAMVDKNIDVPGYPRGKLVDMTAQEAVDMGYADAVLGDMEAVLEYMGWDDADIVKTEPDTKIKIAQFLTRSDVTAVILTIAMIAMVIEILVQGFGIQGIISIIAFMLYFGGGVVAGNTEWWSVFLFGLGIILLIIELFIPGFGIFGIGGIISLGVSIIFASPTPVQGLYTLGTALVATVLLTPILYKVLGGAKLFRRLVLQESETIDKGYTSQPEGSFSHLKGKSGVTVTPMRPAGTILIDGERWDAMSDGSFLPSGSRIKVVEIQGSKIIVTAEE
ncbi:MAG: nodulation protein NfeD [Clostridiales bacterium]|nr:nodulation protein NfeD [Clostridiales bacterium]